MHNKLHDNLNLGRISDIILNLKEKYHVNNIADIPTDKKLDTLCKVIGLSSTQFDNLIAENSPVLRTVKGHTFEVTFEKFMSLNGYSAEDVGGDGDIDLVVNRHNLQLKTPNMGGSTMDVLEYKTHKTHGAKSESESMDYYHKVADFADFFVGLISYNPFQVFIIPKESLPKHPKNSEYIQSPFKLPISQYKQYINHFAQLGISIENNPISFHKNSKELMPNTATRIGVGTDIIVNTILRECNFRIWDMSIRGFAREIAIKSMLTDAKISFSDKPQLYRQERANKADLVILSNKTKTPIFIQVKGISTNNCIFSEERTIIATETQLTRGRVNDHPTQSRLYLACDFDYLILAIDPPISYIVNSTFQWSIYLIPTNKLHRHNRYVNRLAAMQKFCINDLRDYLFTAEKIKSIVDF